MANEYSWSLQALSAIDRNYVHETEKQIGELSKELRSIRYDINSTWSYIDSIYHESPALDHPAFQANLDFAKAREEDARKDHEKEVEIMARQHELKEALRAHFKESEAPRCWALCDEMRMKLPGELRNMVHKALVGSPRYRVNQSFERTSYAEANPIKLSTKPILAWIGVSSPRAQDHWLDERFVGPEILREIIETWYEASTFEVEMCEDLSNFLAEDFWGHGVLARDHLRHVLVPIECDLGETRHWENSVLQPLKYVDPRKHLAWDMDGLLMLKTNAHVTLEARMQDSDGTPKWNEDYIKKFVNAVCDKLPGLGRIRGSGYGASVRVAVGRQVCQFEVDEHDVEMTQDEWVQKISGVPMTDLEEETRPQSEISVEEHPISQAEESPGVVKAQTSTGCVEKMRSVWRRMKKRLRK